MSGPTMGTVREPESATLYYRGRKEFLIFLAGALLLILAMILGLSDGPLLHSWKFVVYTVFAAIIAVGAFVNWVSSNFYFIRVAPAGLTIRLLLGKRFYQWTEIRNLKVIEMKYKG